MTVKEKSKSIYSKFIKKKIKTLLKTSFSSFLYSRLFYLSLRRLSKSKNDGKNIIVFNGHRCVEDIEVYLSHQKITLFSAPMYLLQIVEAIFFDKSIPYSLYFKTKDKETIKARENKRNFIAKTISYLKRKGIDAIISPSIQYRLDQDWAFASNLQNLNFICVHKEFTVMDKQVYKHQIQKFKEWNLKYLGTKVFVTNKLVKKLFIETKFCEKSKINVIGSLRMDRILPVKKKKVELNNKITLFSFGHLSGGLGFDMVNQREIYKYKRHQYFSNDNFGFVKLFQNVHYTFGQCAIDNPQKNFIIKLKNINDNGWKNEVIKIIETKTKVSFDKIVNLKFSSDQAPSLINSSDIIIGFNSTVLLESIINNKKTIIPVVDEAINEYKDNVYYTKYFSLFKIANSKNQLKDLISHGFDFKFNKMKQDKMIKEFLGFSDGKTLERFFSYL